ncbi:MAG TPA: hypothetical protein VLX92_02775 [Kofleriaceae bacterium]|nr:hypothetical protein [Kofleriaceae bacterium]
MIGPAAAQPPTEATFRSADDTVWEVSIDHRTACETPCALNLLPLQRVVMRARDDGAARLDVGFLDPGRVAITAENTHRARFAVGVSLTAVSSMGVATGIALTSVGWALGKDGMRTAGLITGGSSAAVLATGIVLTVTARAKLRSATPYLAPGGVGVAGRF